MGHLKIVVRNLHWIITAALLLGLVPAFHYAGLPLSFNWPRLLTVFWVSLFFRSVFVAVFLCILGFPLKETLLPLWERYRKDRGRLVLGVLFVAFMLWQFGLSIGVMLVVDSLALFEILERASPWKLRSKAADILAPAAYFFVGLLLVFFYNDVIASVQPVDTYTTTYNYFDSILLGGYTVPQIAHALMQRVPLSAYTFLEMVYFGMFGVLGATLLMTAFAYGRRRAVALIGTFLMAYYVAMFAFFLWPSMDPYALCAEHATKFPQFLNLYEVQKATIEKPQMLFAHAPGIVIDTDYFIAFPCMHIALPVIAMWYLRRWQRMAQLIAAYNVVLFASILLLEQHFFVDIIGGVLTAIIAIVVVGDPPDKPAESPQFKEETELALTHV